MFSRLVEPSRLWLMHKGSVQCLPSGCGHGSWFEEELLCSRGGLCLLLRYVKESLCDPLSCLGVIPSCTEELKAFKHRLIDSWESF